MTAQREQDERAQSDGHLAEQRTASKYVIINNTDAPEPAMVCQWVPGVGYCYLDRRGAKPSHDGMRGIEATPVEAFGFVWAENRHGTVSFYQSDRPVTATYTDGEPRRWQSRAVSFEFKRLKGIDVMTAQDKPCPECEVAGPAQFPQDAVLAERQRCAAIARRLNYLGYGELIAQAIESGLEGA